MKKQSFLFFILSTSFLGALEESPWLGDVYAFNLHANESYSRYRYIDNAVIQPHYAYNNYVNQISFSFTPAPSLGVEIECEMARTPHQLYGFRAMALGSRYRFFDDIAGDSFSLVLGGVLRSVGGRSVRDVSSPYASYMNYEVQCSLGKEFSKNANWTSRGYVMGSTGIANHGSFWNRMSAFLEGRFFDSQIFNVFTEGYFGYGSSNKVVIDDFRGWGYVRHSSLDIGASYKYAWLLWGELGISYVYRILAKSYPQNVQTVEISYTLPFSLL